MSRKNQSRRYKDKDKVSALSGQHNKKKSLLPFILFMNQEIPDCLGPVQIYLMGSTSAVLVHLKKVTVQTSMKKICN